MKKENSIHSSDGSYGTFSCRMRIFQFHRFFNGKQLKAEYICIQRYSEAERIQPKSTTDGEVFDDTTVTVFAAKSLNSVMETLISLSTIRRPAECQTGWKL